MTLDSLGVVPKLGERQGGVKGCRNIPAYDLQASQVPSLSQCGTLVNRGILFHQAATSHVLAVVRPFSTALIGISSHDNSIFTGHIIRLLRK